MLSGHGICNIRGDDFVFKTTCLVLLLYVWQCVLIVMIAENDRIIV